jgi:hypothetical protein
MKLNQLSRFQYWQKYLSRRSNQLTRKGEIIPKSPTSLKGAHSRLCNDSPLLRLDEGKRFSNQIHQMDS